MVFSSLTFLLLFLPAVLAVYFVFHSVRVKNIILLIGSLIFYAWGEPVFVLVMAFVTLVVYAGTLAFSAAQNTTLKRILFILTLVISLSALIYFKYAAFFANQVLGIFGSTTVMQTPRLPIGISFFTFQAISYAVDAYRGNVRVQKNYAWRAALCIVFSASSSRADRPNMRISNLSERSAYHAGRFFRRHAPLCHWSLQESSRGKHARPNALRPAGCGRFGLGRMADKRDLRITDLF